MKTKKISFQQLSLIGVLLYLSALLTPSHFLSAIFADTSWGAIVSLLLLPLLGLTMLVLSIRQKSYFWMLVALIFIFNFFITWYMLNLFGIYY